MLQAHAQQHDLPVEQPVLDGSDAEEGEIKEDASTAAAASGEKHPLNGKWTLFYTSPQKAKSVSWKDLVKNIMTIESVEDFWGLYNNIPKIEELAFSSDYNLFREGIFPEWEDQRNREGGKWVWAIPASQTEKLSNGWLNSCLFCIGEVFEDVNEVCGVVASVRPKGHKICLWTKTAIDEEKQIALGRAWKEALELPAESKLSFSFHSESLQFLRSFPKGSVYSV
ncbi:eukaryotic translation initiation factor 4E [Sorochytrium milnesiophthora]